MMNDLEKMQDKGRKRVNIADIPKAELDAIFDKMGDDLELQNQLNKIASNPNFDENKKLAFSKYRIAVAFEKYYFNGVDKCS
jgi:hypothetical protein